GVATRPFRSIRLPAGDGTKFVPWIASGVPALPMAGAKLVIVGEPSFAFTVNADAENAKPRSVSTPIGPVVAELGTTATSSFGVALSTMAAAPLKQTTLLSGWRSNPPPMI